MHQKSTLKVIHMYKQVKNLLASVGHELSKHDLITFLTNNKCHHTMFYCFILPVYTPKLVAGSRLA